MPVEWEYPREPEDIGRLLEHIETLEMVATCYRLGLEPGEELLVRVARTTAEAEKIKAARCPGCALHSTE